MVGSLELTRVTVLEPRKACGKSLIENTGVITSPSTYSRRIVPDFAVLPFLEYILNSLLLLVWLEKKTTVAALALDFWLLYGISTRASGSSHSCSSGAALPFRFYTCPSVNGANSSTLLSQILLNEWGFFLPFFWRHEVCNMVERSGSLSQSFAAWELWLYQGWRDHVILSLPKWELHVTMILLDSCAHVNTATNYIFATF